MLNGFYFIQNVVIMACFIRMLGKGKAFHVLN